VKGVKAIFTAGIMMARILITILLILIAPYSISVSRSESQSQFEQRAGQPPGSPNWPVDHSYGIPFEVVENSGSATRRILIYLEPQYFNEDNLKKVFIGLAKDYPDPYDIFITAYSDKSMIQRAIDAGKSPVSVCFSKGPQGKQAFQEYARKYLPLRSGYYRANFTRMRGEEKLDYSPDPDKEEQITIVIKKREPAYTGDSSHDVFIALEEGDSTLARKLIDGGADINAREEHQRTVLMEAMFKDQYDLVNFLLAKGVETNNQDGSGWTPLMYAAADGKTEIVRELIRRGANVNARPNEGFSALMQAAYEGHYETAKLLVESGADVNATTEQGDTAITLAAGNNHRDIVRLLRSKAER
jgi:hypothetical protein